jgi:hypothetical protein
VIGINIESKIIMRIQVKQLIYSNAESEIWIKCFLQAIWYRALGWFFNWMGKEYKVWMNDLFVQIQLSFLSLFTNITLHMTKILKYKYFLITFSCNLPELQFSKRGLIKEKIEMQILHNINLNKRNSGISWVMIAQQICTTWIWCWKINHLL